MSATDNTELAIEARSLTRRFGDVTAVDGVDLAVRRGEVFGLVGPDGAGKSTLIRLLATVLSPDAGDASIFGASVATRPADVKPRIGYMSQRFSLYRELSVRENVEFFADLRGVRRKERAERAESALAFAGLERFQKRRAEHLSGGMKQKLALAVTLMHEPDLLLLDEPTTGVDPVSRREFWRIIADLHRRGITVLVATPYMDEAERCTHVAFMDGGRLLLCKTPDEIKQRVPGELIELLPAEGRLSIARLREIDGVRGAVTFGEAVRVLVDRGSHSPESLASTLAERGLPIRSARPARMDMEMAFSYLVEQERTVRGRE